MRRSANGQSKVSVLGDTGGDRRDATKKMGAHHQFVLGRRTDRRGCRGALRRVQGGNHRADPLMRLGFRQRRDYGKRYRSCAD
jgi:hypothetical protein